MRCDKKSGAQELILSYQMKMVFFQPRGLCVQSCDMEPQGVKCATNFGHCNNFKVVNKKLWGLHLISKLTEFNLKVLPSEDVYLL